MKKGFYFSMDALMALTVMAAVLGLVSQSSYIATDSFKVSSLNYQKATQEGQDAMSMASQQTFRSYNDSFQDELVGETVMAEDDLDRTVVDGITLLWAARNFSHAEEATQRYFDSRISSEYEYRLQVNEDGSKTVIHETNSMSNSPEIVSSVSRLVSGHEIDRPSEGFRARARAVESKTNQTKVVNIPMMGSGGENLRLRLQKKFNLNATQIHSAKLYFSAHWGQSSFSSNTVQINGQEVNIGGSQDSDWEYIREKGSTHLGFDTADVTSQVQDGWNTFFLDFNNQNNHHVHIHPGTRIVVEYEQEKAAGPERNRKYFANVRGEGQNNNKRGGAWITKPFFIPEDATDKNITARLNVENVNDSPGVSDVVVYLDKEKIYEENMSGSKTINLNLTDNVSTGTNVFSAYVNTRVKDGEVTGFTGQPDDPTIYSDPENDPSSSSSLYVDFESEETGIVFGKIEVVDSNTVGGIAENPKDFSEEFGTEYEFRNIFVNLAQLDSRNVTVEAGNGLQKVFQSPREFATPTKMSVDSDVIEDGSNSFRVSEECSTHCEILPQTSIERRVLVSNQVGYGALFENRSEAVGDANQRLENLLGEYADATSIESDTTSTGNQPYLWGPASVKLVVWDES